MPDEGYEKRLETCWVHVWRAEGDEHFRVTWLPHDPGPDGKLGGRTYTPGDADLPAGFPLSSDPREVMAWAVERWG